MSRIIKKIESNKSCKVIFTDFYDTLVHRTVHPNYTLKLWAKFLIRELGIKITTDELFSIRIDSLSFLSKKQNLKRIEVSYELLINEVYHRLENSKFLSGISYDKFESNFKQADYISETSVQFKNEQAITALKTLKDNGYRIYLVTDFYLSNEIISKILKFHKITPLFNDVFVSCDLGKSKEDGLIYPHVLEATSSLASETTMIGDNKTSDILNSAKFGIASIHTKNSNHHFRYKRNLLGTEKRDFTKICRTVEKRCSKSKHPFSEYIIHFYFFTERLYQKAKLDGVKDLFFLAREGLYLKKIFDLYQELNEFSSIDKINTHYLKASRQSAQQIALKPLKEEKFENIKNSNAEMSIDNLLTWFLFPKEVKEQIAIELKVSLDHTHKNIFKSELMTQLRANTLFVESYEKNRLNQKAAFTAYINSFSSNIESEGIALVDVGWGGTMQECVYTFFKKEIPVTGYYIGLKTIYNIEADTKRFGLNFSLYPSIHGVSFDILKANGQLYEQLLGAPHGSTLGYTLENGIPGTIEFHEENEKFVFDNYMKSIQDYMLLEFRELFTGLKSINYSQLLVQNYMTNMAMRIGILTNKKQIRFINNISKGFYQNVGQNKVGLKYDPNQLSFSKHTVITFLRSPEKVFRYLVKIKPFLHSKGFFWLSWPVNLTYYYMKFNFWVKKKWFPKRLLR